MNFRVILSFIIITFISYLFSRDKTPIKPTVDTDDSEKPVFQGLKQPVNKTPDIDRNQPSIDRNEGSIPPPGKFTVKNIKKAADSVYKGEIGKEEMYIGLDRESIIRGIIMSEVLQKPRSLKR